MKPKYYHKKIPKQIRVFCENVVLVFFKHIYFGYGKHVLLHDTKVNGNILVDNIIF